MNAIENLGKTGVLWLMTKVKNALTGKVDKENGKGLSTNDFTDEYKTAVDTNESNISTLQTTVDTKVTADDVTAQVEAYGYQTAENVETAITAKGYQTETQIDSKLSTKVDKVEGKGLSTNDFTDEYKTKISSNESDISTLKNKIDTKVTIEDVDSLITSKGYQTAENVETAITAKGYQTADDVQSTVNSALEGITGISIEVVNSLPASGTKGVIYLMAHSHGEGDSYDEYVWVENNSSYEKIGNTDVDLSAYVKASDISIISESELEAMWNT